jgi:hypothetical protein
LCHVTTTGRRVSHYPTRNTASRTLPNTEPGYEVRIANDVVQAATNDVPKGGAESSEGRIVFTGKSDDKFLFPTEKRCLSCLFELADVGGLLQIIMVKRGSHSFPVRLPDSQLASVFVPTRDHL